MTADDKRRLTLQYLLDNNVGSFINTDGLIKLWDDRAVPEFERLALLTDLYTNGLIEVFPRDCIDKGLFPTQFKISLKGIDFIDSSKSKLLPAAEKEVASLERQLMQAQINETIAKTNLTEEQTKDLKRKWMYFIAGAVIGNIDNIIKLSRHLLNI